MKINEVAESEYQILARLIHEQAAHWISLNKPILYRATRRTKSYEVEGVSSNLAFLKPIHNERAARDTDHQRHLAFNAMIKAAGGIANRSNSAFVTSDKYKAMYFGEIFIFIPLGEFNYTWSPVWKDWTEDCLMSDVLACYDFKHIPPDVAAGAQKKYTDMLNKLDSEMIGNVSYSSPRVSEKATVAKAKLITPSGKEEEIRRIIGRILDSNFRSSVTSLLAKPIAYDKQLIKTKILANVGFDKAAYTGHEIMIATSEGLYINPSEYPNIEKLL